MPTNNDPRMVPMRQCHPVLSTLSEKSDEGTCTQPPPVGLSCQGDRSPSNEVSSNLDITPDGLGSASASDDCVAGSRKTHSIVPKVVAERLAQKLAQEAQEISPVLEPHMLQRPDGGTDIKSLIHTSRGNLSNRAPKLTVKCQPPSVSRSCTSTEVSPRAKKLNSEPSVGSTPVPAAKQQSQSVGEDQGGRTLANVNAATATQLLSKDAVEMLRKIESSSSLGEPSKSRRGFVKELYNKAKSDKEKTESATSFASFRIRPLRSEMSKGSMGSYNDEITPAFPDACVRRLSSDDICSDDEHASMFDPDDDDDNKMGLEGITPGELRREPITPSPPSRDVAKFGPRSQKSFFCSTPKNGMRRLSSTPALTRKDSGNNSEHDLLKAIHATRENKCTTPSVDSAERKKEDSAESVDMPCYVRLSLAESAQGPTVHALSNEKSRDTWNAESVTVLPAKNPRRKVKNSVGAPISSCTFEILNKKRSPIIGNVWRVDVTGKDVKFGTGDICIIRRIGDTHRVVIDISTKEDSSRLVHFKFSIEDMCQDASSSLSLSPPAPHRKSLPLQPSSTDDGPTPSWERRKTTEPPTQSTKNLFLLIQQAETSEHGHFKAASPL